MSRENEHFVEPRDFGIAATLALLGILSMVVPVRKWKSATAGLARLVDRLPGQGLRGRKEFERLAPLHPALNNEDHLGDKVAQMYFESRMQITDQYLFRKWKPKIKLRGIERIHEALGDGNGVILWISPFAYSDLIAKMGLSLAGIEISHLSRPGHGFSRSTIGMATLNKLRTGIEDKYIKDRVRITRGKEQRAMLALRRVLKKNGIVSITVGAKTRRPGIIPLGDGHLRVATGAVRLSEMTGAPIMPVFTVNTAAQDFIVDVAQPVTEPDNEAQEVLLRYGRILENYVAEYPAQWRGIHDFRAN